METLDYITDIGKFSAQNNKNGAVTSNAKDLQEHVFFENSIGKICGEYITFKNSGRTVAIEEIDFLEIKTELDHNYNRGAFVGGIIALIVGSLLTRGELLSILCFALTILSFLTSLFIKKKKYLIQVVFQGLNGKMISIHGYQLNVAYELIKKVSIYKQQNLNLNHSK